MGEKRSCSWKHELIWWKDLREIDWSHGAASAGVFAAETELSTLSQGKKLLFPSAEASIEMPTVTGRVWGKNGLPPRANVSRGTATQRKWRRARRTAERDPGGKSHPLMLPILECLLLSACVFRLSWTEMLVDLKISRRDFITFYRYLFPIILRRSELWRWMFEVALTLRMNRRTV